MFHRYLRFAFNAVTLGLFLCYRVFQPSPTDEPREYDVSQGAATNPASHAIEAAQPYGCGEREFLDAACRGLGIRSFLDYSGECPPATAIVHSGFPNCHLVNLLPINPWCMRKRFMNSGISTGTSAHAHPLEVNPFRCIVLPKPEIRTPQINHADGYWLDDKVSSQ